MTNYLDFDNHKFNYDTSIIGQIIELPNAEDFIFQQKDYYTSEENYLNEIRQKQQRNDFERKLISCIKEQHFEYGIISKADIFIDEQMKINSLVTKSLLNELFVKNFEVRECGIRCFENWVSHASLMILRNIKTEPKWLQDYLEIVITNIEEELCHI